MSPVPPWTSSQWLHAARGYAAPFRSPAPFSLWWSRGGVGYNLVVRCLGKRGSSGDALQMEAVDAPL